MWSSRPTGSGRNTGVSTIESKAQNGTEALRSVDEILSTEDNGDFEEGRKIVGGFEERVSFGENAKHNDTR